MGNAAALSATMDLHRIFENYKLDQEISPSEQIDYRPKATPIYLGKSVLLHSGILMP